MNSIGRVRGADGESSTALLVSLDPSAADVSGPDTELIEVLSVALKELEGGER